MKDDETSGYCNGDGTGLGSGGACGWGYGNGDGWGISDEFVEVLIP